MRETEDGVELLTGEFEEDGECVGNVRKSPNESVEIRLSQAILSGDTSY